MISDGKMRRQVENVREFIDAMDGNRTQSIHTVKCNNIVHATLFKKLL